ncbi:MAG: hypothetical protein AAFY88_28950, partial [Acidobacteriota bacterium]
MPHDSHRAAKGEAACGPHLDITDRELYAWALQVSGRGAHPTIVLDACLGGGMMRDLSVQPKGVRPDHRKGTLANKTAFLELGEAAPELVTAADDRALPEAPRTWLPPSDRYTLLAACQVSQFCREMLDPETERFHGILSLHLVWALRDLAGAVSWRELHDRIAPAIEAQNHLQSPQIEGAVDREVFGPRTLRPEPFAEVLKRSNDTVTLGQGAVHGVVLGSQWELHGAEARHAQGYPMAEVVVTAVDTYTSSATFTGPVLNAPSEGLRAFEIHRPMERRLRVFVDGTGDSDPATDGDETSESSLDALHRALGASSVLAPVVTPQAADLLVGLRGRGLEGQGLRS